MSDSDADLPPGGAALVEKLEELVYELHPYDGMARRAIRQWAEQYRAAWVAHSNTLTAEVATLRKERDGLKALLTHTISHHARLLAACQHDRGNVRAENEALRDQITRLIDPLVREAALRPPPPVYVCAKCNAAIGLPEGEKS